MVTKFTWFDANSWLVEAGGCRVLIDPWLVGELVFADVPWLVKGVRPYKIDIPENVDLILLSQGLADHAHPETLQVLDKSIPVVASVDGAKVAKSAGFQSVTVANHGDRIQPLAQKGLEIQTLEGAVVGPLKRENGYLLTFQAEAAEARTRLYYEPHGYPDIETLQAIGTVDAVITPLADITLMSLAPVVRGGSVALKIAKTVKPQVMFATAEAGRVRYEGLISGALRVEGGAAEMRSRLTQAGLDTDVIQPTSGETVALDLRSSVAAS